MKPHPAKFYTKLENKTVACFLCPHRCKIIDGGVGICNMRQNRDGILYSLVYGLNSGLSVDPVEKKPLYHFLPGSKTLSFGTTGCNLDCQFCQNWQLSKSKTTQNLTHHTSPQEIAETAQKYDCKSVAFTYNDPIIFAEYAIDTARACHKLDIKTIAVTAGYITEEARKDFFEHMDAANVDLKSFNNSFYQRLSKASLQPVLDTLLYIKNQTSIWLEITTLIIPNENDSDDEIDQMTKWINTFLGSDVPLHFSAFHPDYQYLDAEKTSTDILENAQNIAQKNGLKTVYLGNVQKEDAGTTYCITCQKPLIKRDGFSITLNTLNKNQCQNCQTVCCGIFD